MSMKMGKKKESMADELLINVLLVKISKSHGNKFEFSHEENYTVVQL